jgi:hypothetical protein
MKCIRNSIWRFLYYLENKLYTSDIEDLYVDETIRKITVGDQCITSFYTPYGIKQMDSDYGRRIRSGTEDLKKLRREIKLNPHLHRRIKRNLLYNLRTYQIMNK